MKRIDTSTRAVDLFGPGKDGFKDGNLAGGIVPTDFNADWPNGIQEELANVIEAAGILLSGASRTQLLQALRSNSLVQGVATGTANAIVLTYAPVVPALVDGMVLWFKAAAANTGAATLNVDGLGAKAIVGLAHSALEGGEIIANGKCQIIWNATLNSFVLVSCSGAPVQVAAGAKSGHAVRFDQFANSKATSGWQRLPGGLVLQWGTGNLTAGNSGGTFSFPTAFPTAGLRAVATDTGSTVFSYGIGNFTASAFSVWRSSSSGAADFHFIAVGH